MKWRVTATTALASTRSSPAGSAYATTPSCYETGKANETRLKTASEFQRRDLGDTPFGDSLVRHALYAVWRTIEDEDTGGGLTWLRTELPNYWSEREALISVLRYLGALTIDHWHEEAAAARLVAGAVENDHV